MIIAQLYYQQMFCFNMFPNWVHNIFTCNDINIVLKANPEIEKNRKLQILKGWSEPVNRKRTVYAIWPKRQRRKGQTIIFKTLHRKLKMERHEHHYKPGVNSGAWRVALPTPHVITTSFNIEIVLDTSMRK